MTDHRALAFVHETLPQRVVLEAGAAGRHLAAEVARVGASGVMLVAGRTEAATAERLAAGLPVALRWHEVVQHVPAELAERARAAAVGAGADLVVAIGGGSTTGLAKAVALTTGVPIVAVPTTYAGSEATPVWGLTHAREKTTGVDPKVLPVAVVYDSTLTLSLPVDLSVASGLNALAHCVDSMWAPGSDPLDRALALEGARALASGLPRVLAAPRDIEGRDQCLYGAYLAGVAFASAGSGLHHKICHVLGGAYDLPHAQTHAVVLPHVLALNAPAVPETARRVAEALGAPPGPEEDAAAAAVAALEALRTEVRAPRALRDLGMDERDVPGAVERVLAVVPAGNPAPVTPGSLEALLHAAWAGAAPGASR